MPKQNKYIHLSKRVFHYYLKQIHIISLYDLIPNFTALNSFHYAFKILKYVHIVSLYVFLVDYIILQLGKEPLVLLSLRLQIVKMSQYSRHAHSS